MALSTRFQSGTVICLNSLEINTPYPMTHAERILTEWGWTILVTLQTEEDHNVRYFMPLSFAEVFTDTIVDEINNSVKDYKLIHRRLGENIHVIHVIIE